MTTRSATEVPAAWVPLVVGYGKHLVESLDLAPTTVATTLRRLRVLAAAYPDGPWKLDAGEVQAWVCQASTLNAMRQRESVARSFFAWAAGSGLIAANPAPSRRSSQPAPRTRCLPASSPWSSWLVSTARENVPLSDG
ncbi:MAG: hypothetical protein L6367_17850 [Cellulomonas sp.]|nr:hypothetical protein [Cellulomonas sp.]